MKCPSCGAEASGKFCSSCGSPLKRKECPSCGKGITPGSRFCTNCGILLREGGRKGRVESTPAREGPAGNSRVAWWVAGAMLVVALVALGYPVLNRGVGERPTGTAAPPGMGGASGGASAVDLTTMTLEEQGTLLFNRVMTSSSNGDVGDVEFFQPKAIVIYEQIDPQDPDGLYHFSLLHLAGGELAQALAKAEEGLASEPDYILLMGAAAEAAVRMGDLEGARRYYTHLLEVYDAELGMIRPGYEHHQPMFAAYREAARAFLDQG